GGDFVVLVNVRLFPWVLRQRPRGSRNQLRETGAKAGGWRGGALRTRASLMGEKEMIVEYEGKHPRIGKDVFIAPTAVIIGDVEIGDGVSVWYGVVLRGDEGRIVIGRGSNVQDNAVIHTTTEFPTILKENVTIGHGALLEVCTVEDGAVVGMGAIVLPAAVIGRQSIVGAGRAVSPGAIISTAHLHAY